MNEILLFLLMAISAKLCLWLAERENVSALLRDVTGLALLLRDRSMNGPLFTDLGMALAVHTGFSQFDILCRHALATQLDVAEK